MKISLWVALGVLLLQLFSGDNSAGRGKNQPVKLAAMEGMYKTQSARPAYADWLGRYKKSNRPRRANSGASQLSHLPQYRHASPRAR